METKINIKQLRLGMMVYHESWVASEPMLVVEADGKILLRAMIGDFVGEPDTEPCEGGESKDGWIVVEVEPDRQAIDNFHKEEATAGVI